MPSGFSPVSIQTMSTNPSKTWLYSLFLSLFLLNSCGESSTDRLTIATAANLQYVMPHLVKAFEEETGIAANYIVGSSGKLTAQIQQGAPFDLFISADLKYPEVIYREGLSTAAPEIYAYGQLILWSTRAKDTLELTELSTAPVDHIALANPQLAPYGRAAVQVLKGKGSWEQLEAKLVYGESIAQTNQFISSGAAEWGFTAASVVHTEGWRDQGIWQLIDPQLYDPIAQGVVVLKKRPAHLAAAQKFYTFLFPPRAQDLLQAYGYGLGQ